MRRLSIITVLLATLLSGCSAFMGTRDEKPLTYGQDEIVLQVMEIGPPVMPWNHTTDYTPSFTLWGNGRVIFTGVDMVVHESRLDQAAVRSLMDMASILYKLDDKQIGSQKTDQLLTVFYTSTEQGKKIVKVYDLRSWSNTRDGNKVSSLREQIQAAVPTHADVYTPDEVFLTCGYTGESPSALSEVPAWLKEKDTFKGEDAKRAIALIGFGEGKPFLVDGKACALVLVPSIPIVADLGSDTEYP